MRSFCPCVISLRIIDLVSAGDVVPARCAINPTTSGDWARHISCNDAQSGRSFHSEIAPFDHLLYHRTFCSRILPIRRLELNQRRGIYRKPRQRRTRFLNVYSLRRQGYHLHISK